MDFIADSGFIVSRWSKTPRRKQWAIRIWQEATLPLLTSAANLQEAGWLLENHEVVLRMVRDGDLKPALDFEAEAFALHSLAAQYAPRMDIADAAIVRLSELHPDYQVLTVDKTDFEVYRRFRREKIPCVFPPA